MVRLRVLGAVRRRGLWLAVALLCAGCASTKGHDTQKPALQERLERLANRHGICNAALAVVRQRALQSVDTAYGCTSYAAATPENVFEAASLGKAVFAYAVLKLVQQGRMDLDAPVLSYLPRGYAHRHAPHLADSAVDQVTDPALAAVTVRMALNHTSGLPNWSGGPLRFIGEPGGAWRYSGEGYVLLQRAVEAVTGERFGDFMQRTVFGPLGMTLSAYTREARLELHVVPRAGFHGASMPWTFREPVAAFTLYTNAADYGRFLAALLNDEPTLRQIMASPVPVSAKLGLDWGAGWGLEHRGDDTFFWHWGNNPGYRAFAMVSPRTGDGFVVFTNSDTGLSLAQPLADDILGGPHPAFRYHLLRDGLANLLCEQFDVCP